MTSKEEKIQLRLYLKPELEYEIIKNKLNEVIPDFEVEDSFYFHKSEAQMYIYVSAQPKDVKKAFGSKFKHSKQTGRWSRVNDIFHIPDELSDIIDTAAIDNTPPGLRSLMNLRKDDSEEIKTE